MNPILPPGQFKTEKWPILHEGDVYTFDESTWTFRMFGEVEEEVTLSYKQMMELPKSISTIDMHCVTTWSKFATTFEGVALRDLLKLVKVSNSAKYIKIHGYLDGDPYGYSANLPIEPLMGDDSLFVFRWKDEHNGWRDIDPKHGFPLRFIPPASFYLWKGTKWATAIRFMNEDEAGYWEDRGYSMTADPFKEERFR